MKSNKGRCKKKAVINLTTGDAFDSLRGPQNNSNLTKTPSVMCRDALKNAVALNGNMPKEENHGWT